VFLQYADPASAGNSCDIHVGDMTWTGGVGRLRFAVPDVRPGTYWILADVQGVCWRFGDRVGALLTLSVLPRAVTELSPALVAGVASAVAVMVVTGAILFRRRRRAGGG